MPNLALHATGAVSQTGGALTNVASVAGTGSAFTLAQALNDIATLGPVTATVGDVAVMSRTGLTVAGNVAGANVRIQAGGLGLTLGRGDVPGNLAAGFGGAVSLMADALAQAAAGGSISAPGGTVEFAPYTLNHDMQLGGIGGNVALPGSLTASVLRLGKANGRVRAGNISFGAATTVAAGQLDLQADGDISQVPGAKLTAGTLTLTGSLTGGTVSLVTSASDVSASGGTIIADALTGSVSGTAALTGAANSLAKLGGFTAGGDMSFVDNQALEVTDAIRAGPATPTSASLILTLSTAGTLTLDVGRKLGRRPGLAGHYGGDVAGHGTIDTFALTGHVAGAAALGNAVGRLDAFTTKGGLALVTTGPLTITGAVQAGAGKVLSLTSDGLTVAMAGALGFAGGPANDRINLITDAVSLLGTVGATTAGSVAIAPRTAATLSIGGGGLSLKTTDLANIATGTLVLGSVDGGVTRVGTLDLRTPFALPGGGTLALFADAITQEGAVTGVGLLTGAAGSATLAASGNSIAKLGAFTDATGFSLANGGPLEVAGVVAAGPALALSAAGDMTLDAGASLSAATVSLATTAGGNILGSGSVIAGTLSGNVAGSASLGNLAAPDTIGKVDAFTTGGSFALVDGTPLTVGTLTVAGAATLRIVDAALGNGLILKGTVSTESLAVTTEGAISQTGGTLTGTGSGTLTLQATADITLGGTVNASGSHVVLMSPGTISQGVSQGGGSLMAASLDGGGQAAARVTLDGTGNAIVRLGAFTGADGFVLTNGTGLEITSPIATGPASGAVPDPTLALTAAGNLQLDPAASLSATTVSLTTSAGGNVSGMGPGTGSGSIAAAVLTGNVAGTVTLNSRADAVATLRDLTAGSSLTFVNGGAVQVTGNLTAGSISLGATTLTLQPAAHVTATAVTLAANRDVTELGNPTLQTAELRVATRTGGVTLGSAGNQLAGLGASSAAGDITLVNAGSGLLSVDRAVQAGAGRSIKLTTDQLAINGGLATAGGTVAIAPYTTTRALTLDAARGGGTLSLIQADLANITTNNGTIVLGSVDAGATRAASIAINAPVDVTAGTLALQLFARGDVVANGPGGLAASHLAAASSGGLVLGQANAVDRINALIATAGIVFGDTKDLTVAGPVSAGLLAAGGHAGSDGTIQLSSTGAVTLGGDVLASARQVSGAPPTSLTGITIGAGTTLTQGPVQAGDGGAGRTQLSGPVLHRQRQAARRPAAAAVRHPRACRRPRPARRGARRRAAGAGLHRRRGGEDPAQGLPHPALRHPRAAAGRAAMPERGGDHHVGPGGRDGRVGRAAHRVRGDGHGPRRRQRHPVRLQLRRAGRGFWGRGGGREPVRTGAQLLLRGRAQPARHALVGERPGGRVPDRRHPAAIPRGAVIRDGGRPATGATRHHRRCRKGIAGLVQPPVLLGAIRVDRRRQRGGCHRKLMPPPGFPSGGASIT